MKPKFLQLCGINSFSEPASIDFEQLLDQGIFGIFGDTGSGKSTILDCIGFALYGTVSRNGTNSSDFINFRCEKGYVIFVFEIFYNGARRTYRVEREIKRKKDGSAAQNLFIYEEIGGKFVTVEEGVNRGNAFLLNVIGLKQDDFEKCIALPQGEFARFIKEQPGKRLEIVSRLFDLERFGANLSRRASNKSAALTKDADILAARLEQYADITKEKLAAVGEEISARIAEDGKFRVKIDEEREREKKLHALVDAKKEYEKVLLQKEALERKKGEMDVLEKELGRLDVAKAVLAAERERLSCTTQYTEAMRRREYAAQKAEEAKTTLLSLPAYDEEAAAKELELLSLQKGKAELSADALREQNETKRELALCVERFETLKQRTVDPDYDTRLKELLALQENLGAGDLYAFLSAQKNALYRNEYGRFASEIKGLQEKYPVISPDSEPLIVRYSALSEGEKLDFDDLKGAFEKRENAKKAAEKARLNLESAQSAYLLNKSRLDAVTEKINSLKEKISSLEEKIADAPDVASLDRLIAQKRAEREKSLAAKARAEREKNAADVAVASASAEETARRDALLQAQRRLENMLEGVFTDVNEAEALVHRYGDAGTAGHILADYRQRSAEVTAKYREFKDVDFSEATAEELGVLQSALKETERLRDENAGLLAVARENEKRFRTMLTEKEALEKEFKEKQKEAETAQKLYSLLRGGKFMEYVAEEYLQTVACNASVQLLSLTGGRYFLRYSSGSGFGVGDNFNGGQLRAVGTLSGGETFLVSLSLALALSAEICAQSARPIEFFFLDEGFGTLDEKLVDTVMDSLEKLRSRSFCIGIISHVEELKHRIERKLLVTKATEERGSRITAE